MWHCYKNRPIRDNSQEEGKGEVEQGENNPFSNSTLCDQLVHMAHKCILVCVLLEVVKRIHYFSFVIASYIT